MFAKKWKPAVRADRVSFFSAVAWALRIPPAGWIACAMVLLMTTLAADGLPDDLSVDVDGDGRFTVGDRTALQLWAERGGDLQTALDSGLEVGPGRLDLSEFFARLAGTPTPLRETTHPLASSIGEPGDVDTSSAATAESGNIWGVGDTTLPGRDFETISEALSNPALADGDTIIIYDDYSEYVEWNPLVVSKRITIKSSDGGMRTVTRRFDGLDIFKIEVPSTLQNLHIDCTKGYAAAMYIDVFGNLEHVTVQDCEIERTWRDPPILAYLDGHNGLEVIRTSIHDNIVSGHGGAIYAKCPLGGSPGLSLTVQGCEIRDNKATNRGGAVYFVANEGTLRVWDSVIRNNTAGWDGGGIFLSEYTSVNYFNNTCEIENTAFLHNEASRGGGLALAVDEPRFGRVRFTDCVFRDNLAHSQGYEAQGGAVYLDVDIPPTEGDPVEFTDCHFRGNKCETEASYPYKAEGGAAYLWVTGLPIRIARSYFVKNELKSTNPINGYGTAISLWTGADASQLEIQNCMIHENGPPDGSPIMVRGAIWAEEKQKIYAVNTLFHNNGSYSGGAIYIDQNFYWYPDPGRLELVNCTMRNNVASYGGGIGVDDGIDDIVYLTNNILWNNIPDDINLVSKVASARYNCYTYPDLPGEGNFRADPLLENEYPYFHIDDDLSPCRDAGTLDLPVLPAWMSVSPDLDGQDRNTGPQNPIDIGADETPTPDRTWNPFVRGDANADGFVDGDDPIFILDAIYGGSDPPCDDSADADNDGMITVGDAVYLWNWFNAFGPAPPYPTPFVLGPDGEISVGDCDYDPLEPFDTLGCDSYPPCQ